jgi:type II secretory pathway component PulK
VNADGEIIDEAKAQLQRLFQNLGFEGVENAERIADYIDLDTKGAYEAGARNSKPLNLQELERIEGLPRAVLFGDAQHRGILPFLTVWPKEGGVKVNPNTASQEILQSLDDEMTVERAQAIISWRNVVSEDGKKRAFKNIEDVKKVSELDNDLVQRIGGRLVFKSQAFEIRITSTAFNVERKELYVAGWQGGQGEGQGEQTGGPATLKLLGSMREHEYFDLKPED